MKNGAGLQTVDVDAGTVDNGGDVRLENSVSSVTIELDGENGTGGSIELFNDAAVETIELDSDITSSGRVTVRHSSGGDRVTISGQASTTNGGEIVVLDASGDDGIKVLGEGVATLGGEIQVLNELEEKSIHLLGESPGGDESGEIMLFDRIGANNRNSITLDARDIAGTGANLRMLGATGNQTVLLDSSLGNAGGLILSEDDGSEALSFQNDDLDLHNAAGVPTINFDRFTGTKSAVVDTPSYGRRLFYAMEAPEVWFEDFGSARLSGGSARIQLDPVFLESITVSAEHPLEVFVTLNGPSPGLWVEKGTDHFIVHEQRGGNGNVAFDWRVVAKRKGLEALRLEPIDAKDREAVHESPPAAQPPAPDEATERGSIVPELAPDLPSSQTAGPNPTGGAEARGNGSRRPGAG